MGLMMKIGFVFWSRFGARLVWELCDCSAVKLIADIQAAKGDAV